MSIDWTRLSGAYGPATAMPGHLDALRSHDAAVRARGWQGIEGHAVHQFTRYSCTAAVVGALVDLLVAGHPDADRIVAFLRQAIAGDFTFAFGPDYKYARGRTVNMWGKDVPHGLRGVEKRWLGAIHREAERAVPFLCHWDEPTLDVALVLALFRPSPDTLTALRRLLDTPELRIGGVFGLGFLGEPTDAYVDDPDASVRGLATLIEVQAGRRPVVEVRAALGHEVPNLVGPAAPAAALVRRLQLNAIEDDLDAFIDVLAELNDPTPVAYALQQRLFPAPFEAGLDPRQQQFVKAAYLAGITPSIPGLPREPWVLGWLVEDPTLDGPTVWARTQQHRKLERDERTAKWAADAARRAGAEAERQRQVHRDAAIARVEGRHAEAADQVFRLVPKQALNSPARKAARRAAA